MRIVLIAFLSTIICGVVGAAEIYSPFTKRTFTYNDADHDIIEGDIRVRKNSARNGLRDPKRLWPNRIIPYKIDYNFSAPQMNVLMGAIRSFYEKTCIRFIPAMPFHKHYITIGNIEDACWSDVGYRETGAQVNLNSQFANLGEGCLVDQATPVHELLHTCGMQHEHNRADRDEYLKILWDNINKTLSFNFDKVSTKEYSDYGVPYNYNSVMHYPLNAFSINEFNTMENLKPHTGPFGYEIGWADSDVKKLHLMYNCTSRFL